MTHADADTPGAKPKPRVSDLHARLNRFADNFCTLVAWVVGLGAFADAVVVVANPPIAWRQVAVDAVFVAGAVAWLNAGTVARWVGNKIADLWGGSPRW